MSDYRARVLALAQRIAALERDLAAARAEFAALVPEYAPASVGDKSHAARTEALGRVTFVAEHGGSYAVGEIATAEDAQGNPSLASRIIAIMKGHPHIESFGAQVLYAILNANGHGVTLDSVRTTLSRLAQAKRLERVSHGEYRLAQVVADPGAAGLSIPAKGQAS